MATIRPDDLPPAASVGEDDAIIVDDGATVEKATPLQIVDAAIPLASQAEAETGTDNEKRVTPLRVKQAIDALADNSAVTSLADLKASSPSGLSYNLVGTAIDGQFTYQTADAPYTADDVNVVKQDDTALSVGAFVRQGAASVSYNRGVTDSETISLSDKVGQTLDAADFGVVGDGATDCTTKLQNAIDYMQANLIDTLMLPSGEIVLSGDVTITEHALVTSNYRTQTTVQGRGAGINGSWLHFSSGSLIVEASSHSLRDFRVSSDDDNGIEVKASSTPKFPVRSEMRNIRSEFCLKSGVTIEDCWLYTMINCYFRQNDEWGIAANKGAEANLSCNNLNIIGGEIQGCGTYAGTGSNSTGGTLRGTGGGIFLENAVQVTLTNTAIEGNYGDGLYIGEEVKGLTLTGCYFEKNGTHQDNLDIACATPSNSALGGHAFFFLNCNFTPQNLNGTAQVRAIDLVDVKDAKIVNPMFFALSGPVIYTAEPIRVTETTAGRSTGWVEGGSFLNSGYTQSMLKNSCTKYGMPRVTVYSPNLDMADTGTTNAPYYFAPVPAAGGSGVKLRLFVMPNSGGGGDVYMSTGYRRGPTSTLFTTKVEAVPMGSIFSTVISSSDSSNPTIPGTFITFRISRAGDNAADTFADTAVLQTVEITTYDGWVRA